MRKQRWRTSKGSSMGEPHKPFRTFETVGEMFGKSVKTVGRWVQTIPGFPQPVTVGASRLFLADEIDEFIQKLKEKRDRKKNRL
jgi:predicted DNA-binding transcriptional regulator AlpA